MITARIAHEKKAIGWCLADRGGYDFCGPRFAPEDFTNPAHQTLWTAIQRAHAKRKATNLSLVLSALDDMGMTDAAGGEGYVRDCYESHVGSDTAKVFTQKLLGLKRKDAYFAALVREAKRVSADESDPNELVEQSIARLAEIAKSENQDTALVSLDTCIIDATQRIADIRSGTITKGVPSGIDSLDRMTSHFQPGNLVIVAARTSVGKTAFAATTAIAAARKDIPVALFSLEMDRADVAYRFLAANGEVELQAMRDARLGEHGWAAYERAIAATRSLPVAVFAGSKSTAGDVDLGGLRTLARGFRAKHPNAKQGMVVVDYLQLITAKADDRKRHEAVAELSRGLKTLAMELEWPVVALSQLNREADKRGRPILADLRESGSIEQDADVVILLHRPHKDGGVTDAKPASKQSAYDRKFKPQEAEPGVGDPNDTEIIVAKNRNGAIGVVPAYYRADCALFVGR